MIGCGVRDGFCGVCTSGGSPLSNVLQVGDRLQVRDRLQYAILSVDKWWWSNIVSVRNWPVFFSFTRMEPLFIIN